MRRSPAGLVVAALASLTLVPVAGAAVSRSESRPALPAGSERAAVRDSTGEFDVNEIELRVSNLGWLPYEGTTSALTWPRDSGRAAIFAAGLWIGARVGVDTLVTVAEYTNEYAAGPLTASGAPLDPTERPGPSGLFDPPLRRRGEQSRLGRLAGFLRRAGRRRTASAWSRCLRWAGARTMVTTSPI